MATPYLAPATIRAAVPALADPSKYPDQTLADLVAEFEWLAEDYRGVAFTPRTEVETQTIYPGATAIVLNYPRVRSVASLVVDGVTISSTTYRVTEAGWIESTTGFITGGAYPTAQAVTTYSHGYDVPTSTGPPGSPGAPLLRACREYVRICAIADRSSVPREIIASSADGMTSRYSTPNKDQGRPTGYLEIDRLLNQLPNYAMPTFA
jgi:hypothetical protein